MASTTFLAPRLFSIRTAILLMTLLGATPGCAGKAFDAGDVQQPPLGGDASTDPAASLRGARWELPCTSGPLQEDSRLCSNLEPGIAACPGERRPVDRMARFGGTSGTRYAVTLRVRGVVELKSYQGGTPAGHHFLTGGAPGADVVNAYGISISSPFQSYYINADSTNAGAVSVVVDDLAVVPIDAGAEVHLFALDGDCRQLRNCTSSPASACVPLVVPDIAPAPAAYDGQFAQLDIVSVSIP
jgi:hypothetical protein